jgi:hypothetical protein
VGGTLDLSYRFMFAGVKGLADSGNLYRTMLRKNIEESFQNHFNTFHKPFAVASAFRMFNRPLEVIYDWKKIPNQLFVSKANRFAFFAASSFSEIFQFCDLANIAVVIVPCLFFLCCNLFTKDRQLVIMIERLGFFVAQFTTGGRRRDCPLVHFFLVLMSHSLEFSSPKCFKNLTIGFRVVKFRAV